MSLLCGLLLTFLSAERFDSRVSAHEFWASLGPLACPVLSCGAVSPDPEGRHRCRRLLARYPLWFTSTLVAARPRTVADLFGLAQPKPETWEGDDLAVVLLVSRALGAERYPPGAGNEYMRQAFHNDVVQKVQSELREIRVRK